MQTFGIGEFAYRAGVATSTIRYYKRIGLLPPSQRVSGKRRYDATILQKLAVIRLAQQLGLTIAEIQTLLHDFPVETPPSHRWQSLAGRKIAELDELITIMQARKAFLERTQECQCSTLEDCAVGAISAVGETTIQPRC